MNLRREIELPVTDVMFLNQYGCPWETIRDNSIWLLMRDFSTQNAGYNHPVVTAAIRIETGYPNVGLDMVYFHPALARLDGKPIPASETIQSIDNLSFQRWSRHYTPQNPFVVGEDGLERHILAVEDWLQSEFSR